MRINPRRAITLFNIISITFYIFNLENKSKITSKNTQWRMYIRIYDESFLFVSAQ